MLNSLFMEHVSLFGDSTDQADFKNFMKWSKRSPALLGMLSGMVSDIVGDNIHFEPRDKRKDSRNKLLAAKKFWNENKGMEQLEQGLYDAFITGQMYHWVEQLSEERVKRIADNTAQAMNEVKGFNLDSNKIVELLQEQQKYVLLKQFTYLPATTVKVTNNKYQVTGYVQTVGTTIKFFPAKEIMHLKLMPMDGKPVGFAPVEAILAEIYLTWLITQNYVSFFENGGKPDAAFILPKELAGSKNHRYLVEVLKKYKKIQNKHGNLVITGEIEIQNLMDKMEEMEHKDLGLYLVGMVALMYGIPSGRIPFLVGKSSNNGDSGGLADASYWRKIAFLQTKIEDLWNTTLWEPYFDVCIRFGRGYKQDEVREAEIDSMRTSVAEQRMRLGLWSRRSAGMYLGIDEDELEEAEEEMGENIALQSGMMNQMSVGKSNSMDEPDERAKNLKRQNTQLSNKSKNGNKLFP